MELTGRLRPYTKGDREFEDYRLEKTSTAVPYISLHNLCVLRGLIMSGYREGIHHNNIIAWYTLASQQLFQTVVDFG